MSDSACCAPSNESASIARRAVKRRAGPVERRGLVFIPAGAFMMGSNDDEGEPADGEGPAHRVQLGAYWISATTVSNEEFRAFAGATGYVTDAERLGWSFVFAGFLPSDFPGTRAVAAAPWWRQVFGADWAHPCGPDSNLDTLDDHPAVHVSWHDAQAYCTWRGLRLPTEAEWERAARGGLEGVRYPWGEELAPGGIHRCNTWQGEFPARNTGGDGYLGTAPVTAFEPNGFGLYNVSGNVWEWCQDAFDRAHHARAAAGVPQNPGFRTQNSAPRIIKGGSYLCHESYCFRYRVAARSSNTPESSTGHMGFRVALDATGD